MRNTILEFNIKDKLIEAKKFKKKHSKILKKCRKWFRYRQW